MSVCTRNQKVGKGLINSIINKLPVELHIPGYNFCGPGTKLSERLQRGDRGINPLDEACREHDKAYFTHKDLNLRHKADKILANKAKARVVAPDSSLLERAAALAVSNIIKGKIYMGAGMNSKRLRAQIKKLQAANKPNKKANKKRKQKTRKLQVPKQGGILPLIPIMAGLSALGGLAGGAAKIVQTINTKKAEKNQLNEALRHNKMVEQLLANGKKSGGSGLYLKPYAYGKGIRIKKKR